MDLRSSRSRSRTPFVQLTRLEEENMANSIKQKTIERRTYATRQKTIESFQEEEVFTAERKQKRNDERLSERNRHKTSDYSSEEEHTGNGTFKSALQVYKEAGEYWNKYPKTDYTYSVNSKDRMEVAPGVPCMPNMSRKSLRRSMEPTPRYNAAETTYTSNNVTRKTLNFDETDDFYGATNEYTAGRNVSGGKYISAALRKNSAATENTSVLRRIRTTIRSVITRFYQSVVALFLAVYTAAETSMLWTARSYYQTVSRLFLFDTWLMQKSTAPAQSTRKYGALIAIMFLPLLLFAGWTLWSAINQIIQEKQLTQAQLEETTVQEDTPRIQEEDTPIFGNTPQIFDINEIVSSPEFQRIITQQLNEKMSDLRAEVAAIKTRINELDAGYKAEIFRRETNKCCRRQFIYLVSGTSSAIDDSELNARLDALREELRAELRAELTERVASGVEGGVSDAHVRSIVQASLAVYDADKTGRVDYALESSGGQILSTRCTENYHSRTAVVSILGVPLWYPSNTPRVIITPGATPGECWAFQNFPGFVVVQLSALVRINAVSLEHIPATLAPGGARDSAPRRFSVWGLRAENDRDPWGFGTFEYRLEGPPLQYFAVDNAADAPPFHMVELRVESNHGNMNYTCLYRFRVHGNAA